MGDINRKMKMKKYIIGLFLTSLCFLGSTQTIALLKYNGGGDWYANPTSLTNLIAFCNKNLEMTLTPKYETVEVGSVELYKYPFLHLTGHGNVTFSAEETTNLRNYLISGGFLHVDDNYGIDKFIRAQMKVVFPELEWVELPYNHPIFSSKYSFPNGLPKIHEHDNKPPQAFGLYWEGRLICLYTYECDLGDGWENQEVHHDSEAIRLKALQMGANILKYVFTQ